MDVTKPYKFVWFGDIHGPKPYKFIGIRCTMSLFESLCFFGFVTNRGGSLGGSNFGPAARSNSEQNMKQLVVSGRFPALSRQR